jgi:hypothetical protein
MFQDVTDEGEGEGEGEGDAELADHQTGKNVKIPESTRRKTLTDVCGMIMFSGLIKTDMQKKREP